MTQGIYFLGHFFEYGEVFNRKKRGCTTRVRQFVFNHCALEIRNKLACVLRNLLLCGTIL